MGIDDGRDVDEHPGDGPDVGKVGHQQRVGDADVELAVTSCPFDLE